MHSSPKPKTRDIVSTKKFDCLCFRVPVCFKNRLLLTAKLFVRLKIFFWRYNFIVFHVRYHFGAQVLKCIEAQNLCHKLNSKLGVYTGTPCQRMFFIPRASRPICARSSNGLHHHYVFRVTYRIGYNCVLCTTKIYLLSNFND